jgi:hypothetical protein
MHDVTPDPPTEELIWFMWPNRGPRRTGQVEAREELSDLLERPDEEEPGSASPGSEPDR